MGYIFEDGDRLTIYLPHVRLKGGDVIEEVVEVVLDREGRVIKGFYRSLEEALSKTLEDLLQASGEAEALLDRLEYRLEAEERVNPGEVYTAMHITHVLYHVAVQTRQAGAALLKRRLISYRQYARLKSAVRRCLFLRRYARDIRLLYTSTVQLSLERSIRRLTWMGTVAIPALLITSFYGMNLSWLPLADFPEAVFLILIAVTAAFLYFLRFK